MTLVLAAVTRGFAVIAADRRITYTKTDKRGTRTLESLEDTDAKTIVFDDRYLVGFAGLGRIPMPPTEDDPAPMHRLETWLVDNWKANDEGDKFEALATQMGAMYEEHGLSRLHTFVAVGYKTVGPKGAVDPELVTISNAAFPQQFDVVRTDLAGASYLLASAGVKLLPEEREHIESALQWTAKRRPRQPHRVCQVFAEVVRRVADRNKTVGPTAVVTSLPRIVAHEMQPMAVWVDAPDGPDSSVYMDFLVSWNHVATQAEAGWQHHPPKVNQFMRSTAAVSSTLPSDDFIGPAINYPTSRGINLSQ